MSERYLVTVLAVIAFVLGIMSGIVFGTLVTRDMYQKEAIRAGVACYGAVTGKFMWIASAQEPQVHEEPRDTRRINSGNKDNRIETGNITIKE